MTVIWEKLRNQGDWIVVEGKVPDQVSSLVGHFLRRNYHRSCKYTCKEIPGGTFVALAYVPEGVVEEYDRHKELVRADRANRLSRHREDRIVDHSIPGVNPNQAKAGTNLYDDDEDPLSDEVLERLHGEQPDD